jgi:hypothetical protein
MLPVADVRAAADFYEKKLGFIVAFTEGDPPRFAGVNLESSKVRRTSRMVYGSTLSAIWTVTA